MVDINGKIKNAVLYVVSAVLSILFIWYILYHLFNTINEQIETTPAVLTTVTNTVLLDGYVFRDENVLSANSEGGVNYLFEDGEKVGADTVIANIYSGSGAEEVADRILQIDKKLDILKNSSVSDKITKSDADVIDNKINELYYKMRENISNDDIEYAYFRKDELLTYLNKRQIITKNTENFEEQIITLTRERETLSGQLINLEENIVSDKSGYFYSEIDGFEEIFDVSLIENMTIESFEELIKSSPKDYSDTLTVGKMVNSTEWYILSSVSFEETKLFAVGGTYSANFPFNADISVSMTLDKVIREKDDENAILVFRSNEMPDGFNFFRKQTVQIARESYTGYKVPADAVRVVDGVEGVYTLSGNTVSFKQIIPLTEQDGFFIVEEQKHFLKDEEYYKKLGLYELIIISGKNLYDGKIISTSGVE